MDDEMREYILKRAAQGNVRALVEHSLDYMSIDLPTTDGEARLHEIAGTFDGAADFEHIVAGPYEVNIADWIAEYYAELADGDHDWEVTVTTYRYDSVTGEGFTDMSMGDMPVYKVDDTTYEGA